MLRLSILRHSQDNRNLLRSIDSLDTTAYLGVQWTVLLGRPILPHMFSLSAIELQLTDNRI